MKKKIFYISVIATTLFFPIKTWAEELVFQTIKVQKETPEAACTFEADYPISGNEPLLTALRGQINEMLGGNYHGDLSDGTVLLQHQTNAVMEQLKETASPEIPPMWQSSLISSIKKSAETPTFISLLSSSYLYTGGAHGISDTHGITLQKSDGQPLKKPLFQNPEDKALKPLLKKGLAAYFAEYGKKIRQKEIREADLPDEVFAETDVDNLPLPQSDLFLASDGVVFIYSPYEIASYASGKPAFVIPFYMLKPFLTPEVIALLNEQNLSPNHHIHAFMPE